MMVRFLAWGPAWVVVAITLLPISGKAAVEPTTRASAHRQVAAAPPSGMATDGRVADVTSINNRIRRADVGRVVAVIRAPGADSVCQEIVTRIVAELMTDGVPVVALTCPTDEAAQADCLAVAGTRVSAVVAVHRRDDIRSVEVRTGVTAVSLSQRSGGLVSAKAGGRVHRLADSGTGAVPAALAIRTVELLKAMSVEAVDSEPETPVEEPKAQPVDLESIQVATKSVDSRPFGSNSVVPVGPRNITMSVGAMVFGGFAQLASAYGPTLTVGRRTSDHVLLSLVLAGPMFAGDQLS
ncbi:MAG: hypothetical protein H7X95_07035, partial [Deltaproteobacteria bacterium]|nr:hypothetical protein [Deltaproteobacteria bacterium]